LFFLRATKPLWSDLIQKKTLNIVRIAIVLRTRLEIIKNNLEKKGLIEKQTAKR
jgi:hypothetical protein